MIKLKVGRVKLFTDGSIEIEDLEVPPEELERVEKVFVQMKEAANAARGPRLVVPTQVG